MPLESVFGDGAAGAGEFVCSCKWCKRDQNTPQPLNHLKERNPFLCWRRQGGRECSICPNMIAADPDYKNMNRQVLLDSVTPGHESYSEENQKALDGKLAKYESDRNTNGGRVRATPSGRQTVQARSTAMTESRKFVGYLWPTAYWSENNGGAKPDRKQLGSTKHQGKKVTGVWMKEAGPDPTRAIEVWTVSQDAVDRNGELASTAYGDIADVDKAQEQALKRVRVSSTEKDGALKVTSGRGHAAAGDVDADDLFLDSVFSRKPGANGSGSSRSDEADCDGDAGTGGPPADEGETAPTSPRARPKAKAKAKPKPKALPELTPVKQWSKTVVQKAFNESEQASLKCKQFRQSFTDPRLVLTLTAKTVETLVAAVEKRLTSDLINMYSSNYSDTGAVLPGEPDAESQGMQVFTQLRENQRFLRVVTGLVTSLQATQGELVSAEMLMSEYTKVKEAKVDVTDYILEVVVTRAAKAAGQEKDWDRLVDILNPTSSNDHGLPIVALDDRAALQKRILLEYVLGFAKVEPDKTKPTECTKVADAMAGMGALLSKVPVATEVGENPFILDAAFKDDLEKFTLLLRAPALEDGELLTRAEVARDGLVANKQGAFYKAVTLYSTGMAARVEAEKVFERRHADKANSVILQELVAKVDALATAAANVASFTVVTKVNGQSTPSGVKLPHHSDIADVYKKFTGITSTCSSVFTKVSKGDLARVEQLLGRFVVSAREASKAVRDSRAAAAAKVATPIFNNAFGEEGDVTRVEEAIGGLTCVPAKDMAFLAGIGGTEAAKAYEEDVAKFDAAAADLKAGVPWLQNLSQNNVDILDGKGKKFLAALTLLAEWLAGATEFNAFQQAVVAKVVEGVRARLTSGLSTISGFVTAMSKSVEDVDVASITTSLVDAAVPKALVKAASDEDAQDSDQLGKVAAFAVQCASFAGMSADITVGDGAVAFPVCCASPQLYKACRAARTFHQGLLTAGFSQLAPLRNALAAIHAASEVLRADVVPQFGGLAAHVGKVQGHVETACRGALETWLAKQAESCRGAVDRVSKALEDPDCQALVKRLGAAEIDVSEVKKALEHECVTNLHEAMKQVRVLEKEADFSYVAGWLNTYKMFDGILLQRTQEEVADAFKEESPQLKAAGSVLADFTLAQSTVRPLGPGEVRHDLVQRILGGLKKRKWHAISPSLQERLESASKKAKKGAAGEAASAAAPS
ncbi:unnamed protein product, partial [Prorocentrum cordatum]